MKRDRFPPGVADRLGWYVYRLIDPRNGETFYVGKGWGDRVFQHVKGGLLMDDDEDEVDLKVQRIKDIDRTGLDVAYVIHRHGIKDEKIAYQIEAAVMDAYPGLTNRQGGHDTGDYGCRHVEEIVSEYETVPFEADEPLILISIGRSYDNESKNIYDAVRGVWKINPAKASGYKLVLAHRRGLVVGAFRPSEWLEATKIYFPWLEQDEPRFGFVGKEAEPDVAVKYVRKRVPDLYRRRGAANPIRFVDPV